MIRRRWRYTISLRSNVVGSNAYFLFLALALTFGSIAIAQNPVALINQPLVPDTKAPGGAGFTLSVNGTGFVSTSVVKWNGSARATSFVNTSQLTASILASDIKKAATASVTVVNPGPGGGVSNTVFFPIARSTSIAISQSNYSVGTGPIGVSTADLKEDGKLDIVVANPQDNTISVLLGNGDGTFQSPVSYAVGESPTAIRIADFNRDGKLDLAVRNWNTVSVLLANGDGTFQSQVQYPTGTGSYGFAAADLNADGKIDLVVTSDNTVSVLLGNGDGTFQPHVDYGAGSVPESVAVGDFNRDGKLDLAVADSNGDTVTIFLGNGDGTFSKGTSYYAGYAARYVIAADFNGDGKLDLAVSDQGNSTSVSILLGNGDGTFQTAVTYDTGPNPSSVITADLNGDGNLDLFTTDNTGDGTLVSILLGNGDGSFQPHIDFSVGQGANEAAVGDFNRDGKLDLAVVDSGAVSILLQDGTVFLAPSSLNFGGQVLRTTSIAKTVTLTNVGATAVTISSIALAGTNAADFAETNTCGPNLIPNTHCTISVTFAPSRLGPRAAAVTVTDSAPGSPQSVPLSGFGVTSGANETLSATSLTFSIQLVGTSSPPQSVTVSNYGTQALVITNIVAHGDFGQSHTCGSSLVPLANCEKGRVLL